MGGTFTKQSKPKSDFDTPPEVDEFVIIVFGPSYGESILVHLGQNRWVVVDSCINEQTGVSQPLEYLSSLGVEPNRIELVVASHWHDDHIRGLGQIVAKAEKAKFVISQAFNLPDLATLVEFYRSSDFPFSSGIDEFKTCLDALKASGRRVSIAQEGKPLLSVNDNWGQIWALAPSEMEVLKSALDMSQLVDRSRSNVSRLPRPQHNRASVVLHIKIADTSILLGGDLPEFASPDYGWNAACQFGKDLPKSQVVKIPHHGSESSYSQRMWNELMEKDSISVITPWVKGGSVIPTQKDVLRIMQHSGAVYVTVIPQLRCRDYVAPVQGLLKSRTKKIHKIVATTGAVKLRRSVLEANSKWSVNLRSHAKLIDGKKYKAFPVSTSMCC